MIMVRNPFGKDPMDFYEETSADRIGARIRNIRTSKGMSQAELGEKIGLNADRVQKYENGARKPKADMLKCIAAALGVSTLALTDPVTTSYIGAMYALFELEKCYNMQISKTPDDQPPGFCITADFKNEMYPYMEEWYKAYTRMQSDMEIASSEKERKEILDSYHNWQWTYPKSNVDSSEKDIQKARLKKKIEELQEAYDKLDQGDGE